MKTKLKDNVVITTRDFVRNFSVIGKKPTSRSYTVMSHSKLMGIFTPNIGDKDQDDWWANLNPDNYPEAQPKQPTQKNHLTLKQLREKYSFHGGETNLSQRIDEIVYGIKR